MMTFISILFLTISTVLFFPANIAHSDEKAIDPIEVIMLGDSLTAGYGLEEKDSLPAQLEQALQKKNVNVKIINAGVSGDTTAGGLARLEWTLADMPDVLVIALGANDGLRAVNPRFTRDNLENIIITARDLQPNIHILLLGMLAPPNLGGSYAKRFNSIYPDLSEKYDIPLYPFLLDGVMMNRALNQADGIHPNSKGVKVIVQRMLPFFKKHIEELSD